MFVPFFLFSVAVMLAIMTCSIWGKLGGDERFGYFHPKRRKILHVLHHWMFGLTLVSVCPIFMMLFPITIPVYFILGLGVGLFIDDVIFHNCECYFQRKESF